ncbi:MAG: 16S rRNA (cytidine(1402)-2'-O)-methyltransferase [Angelakisella sp.]
MSKLYIVGTPIGNLGDLSPRAAKTLTEVDFIAAEDTRVSAKILNHLGIKKPMVSYFQHNLRERGEQIVDRIVAGESCAIITDAGMPCVSDPGEDLVKLCHDRGVALEVVPGPSAAITALAASGLATGRFSFEGFLSVKASSRRAHLAEVAHDPRTLLFYEAPHKLRATLRDMAEVFGGDRPVTLARELTKLHEEIVRTTFAEAVALYAQREPRGEYVLVVAGCPVSERTEEKPTLPQAAEAVAALSAGGISLSEAAKQIAAETGYKKGELYKLALTITA